MGWKSRGWWRKGGQQSLYRFEDRLQSSIVTILRDPNKLAGPTDVEQPSGVKFLSVPSRGSNPVSKNFHLSAFCFYHEMNDVERYGIQVASWKNIHIMQERGISARATTYTPRSWILCFSKIQNKDGGTCAGERSREYRGHIIGSKYDASSRKGYFRPVLQRSVVNLGQSYLSAALPGPENQAVHRYKNSTVVKVRLGCRE